MPTTFTDPVRLLLGVLLALSFQLVLAGTTPDVQLQPGYQYLDDRFGDVTLREVMSGELDWQVVEDSSLVQLGYLQEPVWIRLQFSVLAAQRSRYYLELSTPFLNYVDFFLFENTGQGKNLLRHVVAGDKQKRKRNPLRHRFPVLELDNLDTGQYEVYVRVQSDSVLIFPLKFREQSVFFSDETSGQAFYSLFFGMMAALVFYNVYVWYFLRDVTNLYNAAFIASAMLYQASFSGFGAQYLWGYSSIFNDKSYAVGILSTLFFGGRFAVLFVDLHNRLPRLGRLSDHMVSLFGLLLIPVILLPERQVMPLIYSLELVVCAFAIAVLVHQCFTGNYWARFLLAGWFVVIAGTFQFVFAQLGLITYSVAVEYWHTAGLALGNLVVTAALAARLQRERREKVIAVQRALQLAQEVAELTREKEEIEASARDELEHRVNLKTRDLTTMLDQLKSSNQQLEHATFTDPLTGVGNRRYLDSCFFDMIAQCQKTRSPIGVLVIDADHFKRINDQLGHLIGDDCLKKIAGILKRFSRRDLDVVARYGGEEFVLLLPGTEPEGVLKVAESIRSQVQLVSFWHSGTRVPVTVSIGIYVGIPAPGVTGDDLLAKADAALYEAKDNGRNCVRLYDQENHLVKP